MRASRLADTIVSLWLLLALFSRLLRSKQRSWNNVDWLTKVSGAGKIRNSGLQLSKPKLGQETRWVYFTVPGSTRVVRERDFDRNILGKLSFSVEHFIENVISALQCCAVSWAFDDLSLWQYCNPWWLHWYCHDLIMVALCWLVCQSSY